VAARIACIAKILKSAVFWEPGLCNHEGHGLKMQCCNASAHADANAHIASHQRRKDPKTASRDPFFVPHISAL
jgi:hypothetical protein